jgi:hypothetical protein
MRPYAHALLTLTFLLAAPLALARGGADCTVRADDGYGLLIRSWSGSSSSLRAFNYDFGGKEQMSPDYRCTPHVTSARAGTLEYGCSSADENVHFSLWIPVGLERAPEDAVFTVRLRYLGHDQDTVYRYCRFPGQR